MPEKVNLFQQSQKDLIIKILNECNGNLSDASKRIGIGRTTLYRLMKQFNVRVQRRTIVEFSH